MIGLRSGRGQTGNPTKRNGRTGAREKQELWRGRGRGGGEEVGVEVMGAGGAESVAEDGFGVFDDVVFDLLEKISVMCHLQVFF